MSREKNSIKFLAFRVMCCLLSGLLMSMALMGTMDTYSWLSNKFTAEGEVRAVNTDSILAERSIKEVGGNSTAILLKKQPGLGYDPVIYFSVENDAANYVLHINPIRLASNWKTNSDGTQVEEPILNEISIQPNLNMAQFMNLLFSRENTITGKIYIKYLNGFIDEGQDIIFTKQYLMDRFMEEIQRTNSQMDRGATAQSSDMQGMMNEAAQVLPEEYNDEITILIKYLASQRDWQAASQTQEFLKISQSLIQKKTMVAGSTDILEEMLSVEEAKAEIQGERVEMPIGALSITDEQRDILDMIIPGASQYLKEVYAVVENLVVQLNEKLQEVAQLKADMKELQGKNEAQAKEIELLNNKINDLNNENMKLKEKVADLESEIDHLKIQASKSSGGSGGSGVETPGTENPGTENPGTENPGTENPGTENPGTENPGTENPG
ncbi:hypothetical protein, partial [Anaerosolibacter carboniphilus]